MTVSLIASVIEQLEAATVGSKKLDNAIYMEALGNPDRIGLCLHCGSGRMLGFWHSMPEYTSSLDAALSLVPREKAPGVKMEFTVAGPLICYCGHGEALGYVAECFPFATHSHAPTPALALCIAALKAMLDLESRAPSPGQGNAAKRDGERGVRA
jgi:hypothetical protein